MTCSKVLLIPLFISVAIYSRGVQNTGLPKSWNLMRKTTVGPTQQVTSHESLDVPTKDKVQLKVYYETLCPASVDFLAWQLNPAVKRLGSHLEVYLIPYGNAKTYGTEDHYKFTCQHGPKECYRNMVHACAIDVLRNSTQSTLFNTCTMQYNSNNADYKYFVSVLRWCGRLENVRIYDIWKCVSNPRGHNVLKQYGDETAEVAPQYVPYLILDDSTKFQDVATNNLFGTVCHMLSPQPPICLNSR